MTQQSELSMAPHSQLLGTRFGRLVCLEVAQLHGKPAYLCVCDCGSKKVVGKSSLLAGYAKSCGCYRREVGVAKQLKHGMRNTPEWLVWRAMRQRCEDKGQAAYKDYGGRGIVVCDRWRGSYRAAE